MKNIKKFLFVFLTNLLFISCVSGNVDIDFTEENKGTINSEIKISLAIAPESELEKELKKELEIIKKDTNLDFKFEFKGIETDDEKGKLAVFNINSNFNNNDDIISIVKKLDFDIFGTMFNEKNNEKYYISKADENGVISVNLGKSNFIKYNIKVNGKIFNVNGREIKSTNKVSFNPGEKIEFKYKKKNKYSSILYLILFTMIAFIIILIIFFIIKKIMKKSKK